MMAAKTLTKSPTPVHVTRHKDKRANIPTEELRDFVADDEKAPKKILYPRDPSLDPQLVWKGKDEQDASRLEVPAVPIYKQFTAETKGVDIYDPTTGQTATAARTTSPAGSLTRNTTARVSASATPTSPVRMNHARN